MIASFLADAKINDLSLPDIPKLTPSRKLFHDCTLDSAVAATVITHRSISKTKYVYLSADKGNKKGMDHFPKVLSWFDPEQGQVQEFLVDIDAADTTSKDAALAIKNSLCKLFAEDEIKLDGITTDSGGATLDSLGEELQKLGITSENLSSILVVSTICKQCCVTLLLII